MSLEPKVGWLLSYSYLWADEHRRGAEEGIKNRPCALVAATRRDGDRIVAIVVPVTHSPPADPATAIEIPAVTKARLGLDALEELLGEEQAQRLALVLREWLRAARPGFLRPVAHDASASTTNSAKSGAMSSRTSTDRRVPPSS